MEQTFPFQPCHVSLSQYHSEPVMPTVTAQGEPSRYSFPSTTGAQNQQRHGVTPVLPLANSAKFSADRGYSTVNTVGSSSWVYCLAKPLQEVMTNLLCEARALPCDHDSSSST